MAANVCNFTQPIFDPKMVTMKILLSSALLATTLLTGCSALYKTGQTPDDLYYAEGKPTVSRATAENEERYQEYVSTMDDRYLRMKVSNRNRWSNLDDFGYWNDARFNFMPMTYTGFNSWNNGWGGHWGWGMNNFNPGWNMGWNSGWGWNPSLSLGWGWGGMNGWNMGWNNPLFCLVSYSAPKAIIPTFTSGSNLSAFRNNLYNNSNFPTNGGNKNSYYTPGKAGDNNNFGNLMRRVLTTPSSANGNTSSYDRGARTFSNSSAPLNSNAGGSSGGFSSRGSSAGSGRGGRN